MMNSLVQLTIDAHGGLERWQGFEQASAQRRNNGVLWMLKHQHGVIDECPCARRFAKRVGIALAVPDS